MVWPPPGEPSQGLLGYEGVPIQGGVDEWALEPRSSGKGCLMVLTFPRYGSQIDERLEWVLV